MQYKNQRVNTQDLSFTRADHWKHSTWDLFPWRQHLLHALPSTSFDISDDVNHRVPICFSSAVEKCLRPYRTHTDPSGRAVSTASSISNGNSKRKIKQTWGKANAGIISLTDGDSRVKEKSKGLIRPFPWMMSKRHHIFGMKQKLSIYSFYTLSLLSLFYIGIPSQTKSTSSIFPVLHRKALAVLSTLPCSTFTLSCSPSSYLYFSITLKWKQ